jgi:cyanophycin synthetase
MKIVDILVMRGPNQWSMSEKQLIVVKAETEQIEEGTLSAAEARLGELFPALAHLGGAAQQRSLAALLARTALALQTAAGMPAAFYITQQANMPEFSFSVFAYQLEQAGVYAAEAAVQVAQQLLEGVSPGIDGHAWVLQVPTCSRK